MRNPIMIREIGRESLLFIFSKEDCIEIGYTGARPSKRDQNGNVTPEEVAASVEYYIFWENQKTTSHE